MEAASIVGKKEGDGPLGHLFDCIEEDPKFGKNTWEEAESELQLRTARKVIEKSGIQEEQIRYLFAGDLLAQGIATSYGIMELQIPLFGLYGACSTCGESLALASMAINGRLCRLCPGSDLQSLCQRRKRISFSLGLCRTASFVHHLDGYRFRSFPFVFLVLPGFPVNPACRLPELPQEGLWITV